RTFVPRIHHQPHPHRGRMPARRDDPTEHRALRTFGIDVKHLRIVFLRERNDLILREGVCAQFAPRPDLDILEPAAAHARLPMIGVIETMATCSRSLKMRHSKVTKPNGLICEGFASTTSASMRSCVSG